ncbi:serine/threonine-protein kinase [Anoxybacillus tepidamans]|uniref:Serine/threonine-protein kinase n=1 Tax=Anoxybacteroides tepidamans TaxID=265948 RepID=A0A7W8ILX2_9BACL|nr:serine/threonine-protein kinase [Anoxybacillus tepidamans]MBB5323016.1 serine/threonine-protein kinase [Anoxybacillus tepidamans]
MRFSYFCPVIEHLFERRCKKGTILHGYYQILYELGIGSYGITYLATDLRTNKQVVVKQMRKMKRKKRMESFEREANILKQLEHPQIPALYETFTEHGVPHLVMEYIDGDTVESLIFEKGKTYTEKEAFQLLKDVLAVVEYIHKKGIVHRDLRIPNILLRDGRVYVIDFGLARFLHEQVPHLETYVLEKKLRRQIDVKSDLYALGHFLLFLLYSSYEPKTDEERSWEEELSISDEARSILQKMLQITSPYHDVDELMRDVDHMLEKKGMKKDVVVS